MDRNVPISTRDVNSGITSVGGLVEVQAEVLDEDLTRNVEGDLVRRVTRNRYFRVLYHKVSHEAMCEGQLGTFALALFLTSQSKI